MQDYTEKDLQKEVTSNNMKIWQQEMANGGTADPTCIAFQDLML